MGGLDGPPKPPALGSAPAKAVALLEVAQRPRGPRRAALTRARTAARSLRGQDREAARAAHWRYQAPRCPRPERCDYRGIRL